MNLLIRMRYLFLLLLILFSFFYSCDKDPGTKPPRIALTFDDGPDSLYTVQILDILKQKNVKATFFLVGRHIKLYPAVVTRMVREGHEIGNHTYTHLYLANATDSMISREVEMTQHLIDSLCGNNNRLFRAPWNAIKLSQAKKVEQQGYKNITWNIDTRDYDQSKEEIVRFVIDHKKDNGIVLMHSADYNDVESRKNTVDALPQVIDLLREYHYDLVTISELAKKQE